MGKVRETKKWLRGKFNFVPNDFTEDIETRIEYKERWISIYVIYFNMFIISLGFSIILTGVWPYLDKVNHHHVHPKQTWCTS